MTNTRECLRAARNLAARKIRFMQSLHTRKTKGFSVKAAAEASASTIAAPQLTSWAKAPMVHTKVVYCP